MSKVIITYGWCRVSYVILRSLAERGIKVYVGDNSRIAMSKYSRYCRGRFTYPSYYLDPEGFVKRIVDIINRQKADVFFPVYEEVFATAKYRDIFSPWVQIPITTYENLVSVHDKGCLAKIARDCDIPVPMTFEVKDIRELPELAKGINYPAVVKLKKSSGAKGVFYATTEEELESTFRNIVWKLELPPQDYPVIQEFVKGAGYGVSMLFNKGKLRAKFTHKRLREKLVTGGTSTVRISTKNSVLENYAEKILTHINWHGVAMVEFKYNEETDEAWLLEINPRFWGSLSLAVCAGVDFPYLTYRLAVDGGVESCLDYSTGIKSRWIAGDMIAPLERFKNGRSKLQHIKEFCNFNDDDYDDLKLNDLLPFFMEMLYYFSKFLKTGDINPVERGMFNV
jgi:predicted ATP-grasp superfamily ATP-dependent carboligase